MDQRSGFRAGPDPSTIPRRLQLASALPPFLSRLWFRYGTPYYSGIPQSSGSLLSGPFRVPRGLIVRQFRLPHLVQASDAIFTVASVDDFPHGQIPLLAGRIKAGFRFRASSPKRENGFFGPADCFAARLVTKQDRPAPWAGAINLR
jgi:hypothetical protein